MFASDSLPFRRTLTNGFDHHEMARWALEAPELGLRRRFRHDPPAIWAALWGVNERDKNEAGTRVKGRGMAGSRLPGYQMSPVVHSRIGDCGQCCGASKHRNESGLCFAG